MRVLKLSVVAFCACFLIGLGIVSVYPAPAQAIPSPCYANCSVIACGAPCATPMLVEHYIWYTWNEGYAEPCDHPYTCGGYFVGCGGLCMPS